MARTYYKDLYSAASPTDCLPYIQKWAQQLFPQTISTLESPFSNLELLKAIQQAPRNSSPGPDGIPFEYYKEYPEIMAPKLTELANYVMAGNLLPFSMTQVSILLIPKKSSSHHINNYRPISLIDASSRIISKAMLNRLKPHLDTILHHSQSGFTPGRRAEDNITNMLYTIDRIKDATNAYYGVAIIDFDKAFDRISHSYLEKLLNYQQFPSNFVHLVMQFMSNQTAHIHINNTNSAPFALNAGVRQGNPLSPALFNLAIDPLLKALAHHLVGIQVHNSVTSYKVAAFADDLAIIMLKRPDHLKAKRELDIFCTHSKSVVSQKKSIFVSPAPPASPLNFPHNSIHSGFSHLGIHTQKLNWMQKIQALRSLNATTYTDDLSLEANVAAINSFYMSKIYYYDLHYQITPEAISLFNGIFKYIKGFQISSERARALPSHGGFGVLDLESQLQGTRAKFVFRLLEAPHEIGGYFKLRLQIAVVQTIHQLTHQPLPENMLELTNSQVSLIYWWKIMQHKQYKLIYKDREIQFSYHNIIHDTFLLPREKTWLLAWFQILVPISPPPILQFSDLEWSRVTESYPEWQAGIKLHDPPIALKHFNHRSKKLASLSPKFHLSSKFIQWVPNEKLQRFWSLLEQLQIKYGSLDYIKLFHLGYLNYKSPEYFKITTSSHRPFVRSNWLPASPCFFCLSGSNSPRHIYGECKISYKFWLAIIAHPRPPWPNIICNLDFNPQLLDNYYRVIYNLLMRVVKMHAENNPTPEFWYNQIIEEANFRAYI